MSRRTNCGAWAPARALHSPSGQVLWSDSPGSRDIGRSGSSGADGLASGENARLATFDCSSIRKRSTWRSSAADTPCVNSELLPALASAALRLAEWRYCRSGSLDPVHFQYAGVRSIQRTVLSVEKESPLSIVEPLVTVSEAGVQGGHASTSRSEGSRRRRRLSKNEAIEIARLYGETSTPTSEIRQRFGIGDSSLYRIVQRQGIALRGRTASSTQPTTQRAQTPAARRPRSSSPKQPQKAASRTGSNTPPRPTRVDGRTGGTGVRRAPGTKKTTAPSGTVASGTGNDRRQFRIVFRAERVVQATDIADALRQVKSLGAIEITAVARLE
jgi:transposase-like protein